MTLCFYPGCNTFASFNFANLSAHFCLKHKTEKMVNVRTRLCNVDKCFNRAYYNFRNNKSCRVGGYCIDHREAGMVNIFTKHCKATNCYNIPYFNYLHGQKPIYCTFHKLSNMIDVKNKTCVSCSSRASFNIIGETPAKYCAKHKTEGMVHLYAKKCEIKDCNIQASYNYSNSRKKDFVININQKI